MWIDESAPISLEAAELLGLPFGIIRGSFAYKIRHTDEGLEVWARELSPRGRWTPPSGGVESLEYAFGNIPLFRARPGCRPEGGERGER